MHKFATFPWLIALGAFILLVTTTTASTADEPTPLHSLTSTAGSTVEAKIVGLTEDKKGVVLLVKNTIPLAKLNEQSRDVVSLAIARDARTVPKTPIFIHNPGPELLEMTVSEYLERSFEERVPLVGAILYGNVVSGLMTPEFTDRAVSVQEMNSAAARLEVLASARFTTNLSGKQKQETKFAVAMVLFLRSMNLAKPVNPHALILSEITDQAEKAIYRFTLHDTGSSSQVTKTSTSPYRESLARLSKMYERTPAQIGNTILTVRKSLETDRVTFRFIDILNAMQTFGNDVKGSTAFPELLAFYTAFLSEHPHEDAVRMVTVFFNKIHQDKPTP